MSDNNITTRPNNIIMITIIQWLNKKVNQHNTAKAKTITKTNFYNYWMICHEEDPEMYPLTLPCNEWDDEYFTWRARK